MIKNAYEVYKYCYQKGNVVEIPREWKITRNFYWHEAFLNELKSDGLPFYDCFQRIAGAAEHFQLIRDRLGKPFIIHSWYRCPAHNKRAGSTAALSMHCYGTAIDFHVDGMTDENVRREILVSGVLCRIEDGTTGWVHIDNGNPYIHNGYKFGLFKA